MKRKYKRLAIIASFFTLCLAIMVGGIRVKEKTASAETVSTGYCLTNGTSQFDSETKTGYFDNTFLLYMYGERQNGIQETIEDGAVLDWTKVNVVIQTLATQEKEYEHTHLILYKEGIQYSYQSLDAKAATINASFGALPDGNYRLEYAGEYRTNTGIFIILEEYIYTFEFAIDTTAPTHTLKAGGEKIESGSYTRQKVTYTARDANYKALHYMTPDGGSYTTADVSYTISPTIENNGWWYFYAEDILGARTATVSVYMDMVKPMGVVKDTSGEILQNGGYTNKTFFYQGSDEGRVAMSQIKQPNQTSWMEYTGETTAMETEGVYSFRTLDVAGNISEEYSVCYDVSTPQCEMFTESTNIGNGDILNAEYIAFTANDSLSGIAGLYVKTPDNSACTVYADGSHLTMEGEYSFYAIDIAGNRSEDYKAILDKTPPTGIIYGDEQEVENGKATAADCIRFEAFDKYGVSEVYVQTPNSAVYELYNDSQEYTKAGKYSFYAVDKAGNESETYTVTINREKPKGQLYVDEQPITSNSYTNGAHIKFVYEEICYVKLPGSDEFAPYTSGVEYHKAGKYVFYGETVLGLTTDYYTVVIDRTVKTVDLQNVANGKTNGDVVLTWTDGDPNLFAPIQSVTVNGKAYVKDTPIYTIDTGVYKVKVTDQAGNTGQTELVSTKQNILTKTLQKQYYETYDENEEYLAFASCENALIFALERERLLVKRGEWTSLNWDMGIAMDTKDSVNAKNGEFFIYKKLGDPDEEVAYFTEERLNEVIAEYAKTSVKSYYYFEKEPALIADGEDLYAYSKDRKILASDIMLGENITCLLNGEPFIAENLQHGLHTLTVSDEWGNCCEYELHIIRNTPEIYYKVEEGNLNAFSFNRVYHFGERITVSIADEYDEMAMFQVFDMQGSLVGIFSLNETFCINQSGKYTVQAINHAGKSATLEIWISLNAPKIEFFENTEENTLEIVVTPSVDVGGEIHGLEIYKLSSDGETWELLEQDDNGTLISAEIYSYSFTATGQYKVVVTDLYRTGFDAVEKEFSFTEKVEEVTKEETTDTPAPIKTDESQGGMNGFVIVSIVVGVLVVGGVIIVVILKRRRNM